jgi:hypothetical protein
MLRNSIRYLILLAGLLILLPGIKAQTDSIPVRDEQIRKPFAEVVHKLDFGVGFGLDYGGLLGVQIGFAPVKHLTLFAAGGYYIFQFGYQVGIKGLFIPKTSTKAFRPFLKAMYGTNSIITVEGTEQYDEVYSGMTLGFGMEFRFGQKKQNGLDIDLNVPLRTVDFWDDWNTIKNDPTIEVLQEPLPIAFSIGFHHEF